MSKSRGTSTAVKGGIEKKDEAIAGGEKDRA